MDRRERQALDRYLTQSDEDRLDLEPDEEFESKTDLPPPDGGAAFPHDLLYDERRTAVHGGMSLRDYFAGQVLMGMLASKAHSPGFQPEEDAAYCYSLADAMLAARGQQQRKAESRAERTQRRNEWDE